MPGAPTTSRSAGAVPVLPERAPGTLVEIWLADAAAEPMRRVPSVEAVAGRGLAGDRYARGGGTWAQYPDLEKQVTLIDRAAVAEVAEEIGAEFSSGDTRRNLVTTGIDLPGAGRPVVHGRRGAAVRDEALPALHPPGAADGTEAGQGHGAPGRDQRGGVRRRAAR